MKVNELKDVLNTDTVLIYVDNTVQRFFYAGNKEYIFNMNQNINLWDVYGNYEIAQVYADEDDFVMSLK